MSVLRLRGQAEMARFRNPNATCEQIARELGTTTPLVRALLGEVPHAERGLSQYHYPEPQPEQP